MKRLHCHIPVLLLLLGLSVLTACNSDDHEDTIANWKWDKGLQPEENTDITRLGWTNVNADYGRLPAYINVYKAVKTPDDKPAVAFIAIAELGTDKAKFSVSNDIHWNKKAGANGNEKLFTPTEFYNNYESPVVVINGGLFFESGGFYYSQSSCYSEGSMLSPNQNYWSENWTDFWYPTIGFFYQDKAGEFYATWTYYASDGKDYSYSACKKIDKTKPETTAPDANSPSKGTVMNDGTAVYGIGGVSVLLHEGKVMNTWADELLDVAANSAQPRTAIGYDAAKKRLVFFVCEGRRMTPDVLGMTTAQVADMLKAIGCTEALNLDGGGSSCMLINGKQTIKPSDKKERAVIDACFIK